MPSAEAEEEAIVGEEFPAEIPAAAEATLASVEAPAGETAEPLPPLDTEFVSPEVLPEPQVTVGKPQIRFAEDIVVSGPTKPEAKSRRKKKKVTPGREAEDGIKLRKARRVPEIVEGEDEEY